MSWWFNFLQLFNVIFDEIYIAKFYKNNSLSALAKFDAEMYKINNSQFF